MRLLNFGFQAKKNSTHLQQRQIGAHCLENLSIKGVKMVIYQNYTTDEGVKRVKAYSDKNVYIERDGVPYSEADDFVYQNRKYAETDEPIGDDVTITETKLKSDAYDYLTRNIDFLFDHEKHIALQKFWDSGIKISPRVNPG